MNNLESIKTIEDLLQFVRFKSHPVLINICPACQPRNFLMEEVLTRIVSENKTQIDYLKIDHNEAKTIMEGLKLTKTPIFLVTVKGEIMEVLSGTIGYQQLNRAISKVIHNENQCNNSIAI